MSQVQEHEILYLSKQHIVELGGTHSAPYVAAVTRAFELHAKGNICSR